MTSLTAHGWANYIRLSHPATFGGIHCGDQADVHDSEFRRWARMRPVHLCRLRELARRQAAESRQAEGRPS